MSIHKGAMQVLACQRVPPPTTAQNRRSRKPRPASTVHYREDSDPLAAFVHECCTLHPDNWASSSDLRREYEKWCSEQGEKPISGTDFNEGLRRRGCEAKRRHAGRGWAGIGLQKVELFDDCGGQA
jgi:putative DNA primase/helicase